MKAAILAVTMLLTASVSAGANFFGPQFCAAQFHVAKLEREAGFRTNEVLLSSRRTWHEKMTRTEWVSCMCAQKNQSCDCCAYDIAKICAEIVRLHVVTGNVLRVPPCEEGQR